MSPERKAAERIFEFGTLIDAPGEGSVEDIAAIIREEHAPMRAMMERMVEFVPLFAEGAEVLSDYAEMKAGWEAADD